MHLDHSTLMVAAALTVGMAAPANAQTGAAADAIELALSAAPDDVARTATVVDLEGNVLRRGDGPFTCLPIPDAPMCMDAVWLAWFDAYVANTTPPNTALGLSYMLAGDAGASNVDPRATGPTASNAWVVSGPHLMLLVPDARALDGLPTDPANGGPFVMWKGTPYAHVMVPVPGR